MRDRRCQKSEDQIADELTGNWRPEHLFNLCQALKMYDQFCQIVTEYDAEISAYIKTLQPGVDDNESAPPPASKSKARNIAKKGQEPMRQALYQLTGFDLTTIDGIGVDTAAVVISELGPDFSAFPDEGHFVSYLRLAPNLSISAGKKVPSKLKGTTTSRVATFPTVKVLLWQFLPPLASLLKLFTVWSATVRPTSISVRRHMRPNSITVD